MVDITMILLIITSRKTLFWTLPSIYSLIGAVFEINEDEINKNKCCLWILCNVFSFYIKEKFVGPVKILQDQQILGVTGPMGPVTV